MLPLLFARDEKPEAAPFAVTVVHTNDWHANHLPQPAGDGGSARQTAVIKQIKSSAKNVLLLDAGDRFTGTVLHQPGGQENVPLMNDLGFQAMTLGNHEFDDGDDKLALFIKRVKFPVVSANLDVAKSRDLSGLVKPFVVVEVGGQKFGIIGLTTADTKNNSNPGRDVGFDADYVSCVQRAADQLERDGVDKVIVLSHIGLGADRALAARVSGVDAIVGGHSHTVLSKTYREAKDTYPVVVKDKTGQPVYIVQAGGGDGRYVGRLELEFDAAGHVTKAGGDCIHLSRYITPDAEVNREIEALDRRVGESLRKPIIGPDGREAKALADFPNREVRDAETALGDLITDAMRKKAKSDVAITGGGTIRTAIPEGAITGLTLYNVLPFNNTLCRVRLSGRVLVQALEHGVSNYTSDSGKGRFLQVSGLRYSFDPSMPVGKRVVKVEVLNDHGYGPFDPDGVYWVACDSFQYNGGDGYIMLKAKAESAEDLGFPVRDVVEQYVIDHSPVRPRVEGRIVKK